MRQPFRLSITVIVAVGLGAALPAQEPPRFSSSTELVELDVRVVDADGHDVNDLPESAFTVLEDGHPQTISVFMPQDVSVTAGLIVDSSISMWSIRDRLVTAAVAFGEESRPGDELFALAFNERVHPALTPEAPFTSDVWTLREGLQRVLVVRGRTALFDAVDEGLDYAAHGTRDRRALVVVSDGGDNASHVTFDDVLAKALTANTVIYAVGLVDPDDHDANLGLLRRLAHSSGGDLIVPTRGPEVTAALAKVARDLRHAYSIGYVPTRPADGSFRRIRVVMSSPTYRNLVARARDGYYAVAPKAGP